MQQRNWVPEMTIHNLTYLASNNHIELSLKGMLGKFYIISFTMSHNWFVRPYSLLKTQFSIKNNLGGYFFYYLSYMILFYGKRCSLPRSVFCLINSDRQNKFYNPYFANGEIGYGDVKEIAFARSQKTRFSDTIKKLLILTTYGNTVIRQINR